MTQQMTRRGFIERSSIMLAGVVLGDAHADAPSQRGPVRFGMLTDPHYADRDTYGSRFFRDSLDKMNAAVNDMNGRNLDFVIELGDFKDEDAPAITANTRHYLRRIESVFVTFHGPRYHVLGNHDMDSLSKPEFLAEIENTGIAPNSAHYAFDVKGLHCVALDANYRADGVAYSHNNFDWTDANVPDAQLDWLRRDLAATHGPVVVFIHQRLDGEGDLFINNAAAVRSILEESGKTLAVLQGHHHGGDYMQIKGIHYYTLRGMVEGPGINNNAYAVVELTPDNALHITGYGMAASQRCEA